MVTRVGMGEDSHPSKEDTGDQGECKFGAGSGEISTKEEERRVPRYTVRKEEQEEATTPGGRLGGRGEYRPYSNTIKYHDIRY